MRQNTILSIARLRRSSLNQNGCFEENILLKGYFLNGSGEEGKSVIECNGTQCTLATDSTAYTSVGKVKVEGGKVKMCVAVGCSGNGEVEIEASTAAPVFKTVTVGAGVFPGVAVGSDITVKIANDGSVIRMEEIDNVPAQPSLTKATEGNVLYFYDRDGNEISDITAATLPTDDIVAYQCTYAESDNLDDSDTAVITLQGDCTRVKGYATLKNGSILHCSGWRRDGCVVTNLKACTAEDEGRLGTGKKLCVGGEAVSLPSGSEKRVMALELYDANGFYGREKSSGLVYLELTANAVLSIDPPVTKDGKVVTDGKFVLKSGEEYKLIKYDKVSQTYASDDTDSVLAFEKIGVDFYIHYTTLNISPESPTVLFDCYKGVCKKTQGFMFSGAKIYKSNDDGTWTDKTDDTTLVTTGTCSGDGEIGKLKIDSSNLKYCRKTATPTYEFINSGVHFKGTDTELTMVRFGSGIVATPTANTGYYYVNDYIVTDTAVATAKLVQCDRTSCKVNMVAGIYYNGGGKLIKCSGDTVTCDLIDAKGYYLDSENKLVKCDGESKCVYDDSIGFFVDKNGTDLYIECTSQECKSVTKASITATCNSDAQIGKLVKDGEDVKVCLKNGITTAFQNDKKFVVAHQTGSVYRTFVNKSTYSGLVDVKSNAIRLFYDNTFSDFCVDDETMEAATKSAACGTGKTYYICNVDGVCMKSDTNDTLPDSIRHQKVIDTSGEEEESTSAKDLKIVCNVLDGTNCDEKNYYLVDKSTYEIIDAGSGALYYCTTENEACTEIHDIGYFIVNRKLGYSCEKAGDLLSCTKLTTTGEGDSEAFKSTCGSPGDIIYTAASNKIFLCFSDNTSPITVELNSANSGDYALPKGDTSVFGLGNDEYAIITIKDKNVTLNSSYNKELKYVYANKKASYKVIGKDDTCPKVTGGTAFDTENILEMRVKEGYTNYEENTIIA